MESFITRLIWIIIWISILDHTLNGKNKWREMITENQRDYIIALYNELNMEIDIEEIEELSKSQAHKRIQELLELKLEVY